MHCKEFGSREIRVSNANIQRNLLLISRKEEPHLFEATVKWYIILF